MVALRVAEGASGSPQDDQLQEFLPGLLAPSTAALGGQSQVSLLSPAPPASAEVLPAPIFSPGGVSGFLMSPHQELMMRHHLRPKFHINFGHLKITAHSPRGVEAGADFS